MARTPAMFKQSDVERAIKSARNTGLDVGAVEITKDGTIRVVVGTVAEKASSPFDGWKRAKNASAT